MCLSSWRWAYRSQLKTWKLRTVGILPWLPASRHVPEVIVERLKAAAQRKSQSMGQEVRDLLAMRYAPQSKVTRRIRQRWESLPPTSEVDIRAWRET
jgi:hypothetical protein